MSEALKKAAPRGSRHKVIYGIGIGNSVGFGLLDFLDREEKKEKITEFLGEEREKKSFAAALDRAKEESRELYRKTLENAGREAAAIFEIHEMLLSDPDFVDSVNAAIESGTPAAEAVLSAGESLAAIFERLDDEYLAARGADMRDIAKRVYSVIVGKNQEKRASGEKIIPICRDLSPGDTANLDTSGVAGFVTFSGSVNSHTAILARAMDIPALVRAEEIGEEYHGAPAIIDPASGCLFINPTPEEMLRFAEKKEKVEAEASRLRTLTALPAVTKSGKRIALYANIGSPSEAMAAHKMGAEGIGLFRSEFLFIGRDDLPTEAEQFEAYSSVARLFGEKKGPVVIRTLDIGADKILPSLSFGEEDNPALGMRGIRLCLAKPEVFRTQLRAILRASAFGKVAIMLPMVTNIDEVRQTRRILSEEKNRLRFEEVDFDENIGLGIMIETPAAAIMAEKLAGECDFFSVGTNDLFQYTMAADRQNHHLSYLAEGDGIEPVLRLIKLASDGIHAAGGDKWIGICGEMAADESLTELLISSGIDELSVSPPYIARVKERIRSID